MYWGDIAWLPTLLALAKRYAMPTDVSFLMSLYLSTSPPLHWMRTHSGMSDWSRNRWVEPELEHTWRFENPSLVLILWLVKDDPIADDFVLYNVPRAPLHHKLLQWWQSQTKVCSEQQSSGTFFFNRQARGDMNLSDIWIYCLCWKKCINFSPFVFILFQDLL